MVFVKSLLLVLKDAAVSATSIVTRLAPMPFPDAGLRSAVPEAARILKFAIPKPAGVQPHILVKPMRLAWHPLAQMAFKITAKQE